MLTVVDDERGSLRIEFWRGDAYIHAAFRQRISAMRAARAIWPQVRDWLRSMGHQFSFVVIPDGDEMLARFERIFGFREIARAKGHIVMAQRN